MPVDFKPDLTHPSSPDNPASPVHPSDPNSPSHPSLDFQPHPLHPHRRPFAGIHFSHAEIQDGLLTGSRRGSSGLSPDETARLQVGRGAPAGIHFYREGSSGDPAVTSRPHHYRVSGEKAIAELQSDPVYQRAASGAFQKAVSAGIPKEKAVMMAYNEGEHALRKAGWDGFYSKGQPESVFLFGDHQAHESSVGRKGMEKEVESTKETKFKGEPTQLSS